MITDDLITQEMEGQGGEKKPSPLLSATSGGCTLTPGVGFSHGTHFCSLRQLGDLQFGASSASCWRSRPKAPTFDPALLFPVPSPDLSSVTEVSHMVVHWQSVLS